MITKENNSEIKRKSHNQMNQKNHSSDNIPKLRFPEFKDEGEWVEKNLEEVINDFIVPMRDKPKDLNGNIPWCRIEDFDGMYLYKSKSNQGVTDATIKDMNLKVYPPKTLLVSCSADLGRCAITGIELITNQTFIGLVPDFYKANVVFLYYLMTNSKQKLNALSSGTTISYLSRHEFEIFTINIPKQPEQQKIALCLSSIDDFITAQTQKLEALKAHKKGLMQQLFPAEGETVPKMRFAEFRDAGEWEKKEFGEVSDVRDGTHDSPIFFSTGKPLVTSKNLLSNGSLDLENTSLISEQDYEQINKRSRVDVGDILFGMIGTIGNPVMVQTDGFAIKNVALIKQQHELLNRYLVHFLNSDYIASKFNRLNTGNTQKFIALGIIRSLEVPIPTKPEQQIIADCLSSIDELITAQSQKLDALKVHKKGLMQGLFPSV